MFPTGLGARVGSPAASLLPRVELEGHAFVLVN